MYQEPEKHDLQEKREINESKTPNVGISKGVKVAIITMLNKMYSEWKKKKGGNLIREMETITLKTWLFWNWKI